MFFNLVRIISLNFDTVAENLCKVLLKAKLKKKGYVKIDDKLGKYALLHQTTKYKILETLGLFIEKSQIELFTVKLRMAMAWLGKGNQENKTMCQ